MANTKPSRELTDRIRSLIDRLSVPEVGRRLGLAEATVARLAAGCLVAEGTLSLVDQRIEAAEKKGLAGRAA